MRYIVAGILSELSCRLRSIRSWAVLLMLPVMVLAAGSLLPDSETSTPVQVGVALPEEGAEEMWELLSARSGSVLTFVPADTDTIDRNIAAGRWDCGLVLAEDFEERLEELDLDQIITLRIGPGSTVYPLVKESVSACMVQLVGPGIAREYLLDSGIVSAEALPQVQPRLEGILGESDRVIVTMSTPDGRELEAPELTEQGNDAFLCWMVSAVILVRMLLGAADLGRWSRSAAAQRMQPLRSPACLLAARGGADGIVMFLSGASAMLLLGEGMWGVAAVLAYVLFWLAVSILLARFRSSGTVLPVCVPFAAVLSLLLSSVLVDISLIVSALSGVSRWLPVTLFLRIGKGDAYALAVLFGAAISCLALSCVIDLCQRNRAIVSKV